jgi:hypothetical protein
MPKLTRTFYVLGWLFVLVDIFTFFDSAFGGVVATVSIVATILVFGLGAIIHKLAEIEEHLQIIRLASSHKQ